MSDHTTREPVDGVFCVVWIGPAAVIAAWDGTGWWEPGRAYLWPAKVVTHWTTLAEAKAGPELLAACQILERDGLADCNSPEDPVVVLQLTREEFDQILAAIKLATTP